MIAVVLKSDKAHVWEDAAKLLEYGLGIDRAKFQTPDRGGPS
jgi:D-alanyl-D-alanine carboxypeptidase